MLDVFLELWGKPRNPHTASPLSDGAAPEWMHEGDNAMCHVVASALRALPPRDAIAVMAVCCLDNHIVELYEEEAEHKTATASAPRPKRGSAEHTCAVLRWCFWHSDPQRGRFVSSLPSGGDDGATKRAPSSDVKKEVFEQRLRAAQHPAVVAAVVSAMILIGAGSPRACALELCDAYVALWLRAPSTVGREAVHTVIRSATEAAAIAGDSELVTRLIFLLFRIRGALALPTLSSAQEQGSRMSIPGIVRQWMSGMSSAPQDDTQQMDSEFDITVAVLLQSAIRAASSERGIEHAEQLFETLRTGCTWRAASAMGLEVLDALVKLNVVWQRGVGANDDAAATQDDFAALSQRAFAVLGKLALMYPRSPSPSDERTMQLAVRRTMQIHFEYLPTSVHTVVSSLTAQQYLYWPRPRHPMRSLELYERLPLGSMMRRDVRYLALSSACFLQNNDRSYFGKIISEQQADTAQGREFLPSASVYLLTATWVLGCLCWEGNEAVWRSGMRSQGGQATTWLQNVLATPEHRIAVFHAVCGILLGHGCPAVRQQQLYLEWCSEILSTTTQVSVSISTADALLNALVQQPLWKMEGPDAPALMHGRKQLMSKCISILLNGGAPDLCEKSRHLMLPQVLSPSADGSAAPKHAVILHPSVCTLTAAQFDEFLRERLLLSSSEASTAVLVAWELLSPTKSPSTAAALCGLLRGSAFSERFIVAVSVAGAPLPSHADASSWVDAVLTLATNEGRFSDASVWAEDTDGGCELPLLLSRRVATVSARSSRRLQSLNEIQEVFAAPQFREILGRPIPSAQATASEKIGNPSVGMRRQRDNNAGGVSQGLRRSGSRINVDRKPTSSLGLRTLQ
jgi:hypothetical protein